MAMLTTKPSLELRPCFARARLGECSSLNCLRAFLATDTCSIHSSLMFVTEPTAATIPPGSCQAWLFYSDTPLNINNSSGAHPFCSSPGSPEDAYKKAPSCAAPSAMVSAVMRLRAPPPVPFRAAPPTKSVMLHGRVYASFQYNDDLIDCDCLVTWWLTPLFRTTSPPNTVDHVSVTTSM